MTDTPDEWRDFPDPELDALITEHLKAHDAVSLADLMLMKEAIASTRMSRDSDGTYAAGAPE